MEEQRLAPVGIFDSGIGGISVLRELILQMPFEDYYYVADQGHVPYGRKSTEQVKQLSCEVVEFLLDRNVKIIVIACNTVTTAAISWLREIFPATIFVGTEPAVKPAAEATQTGKVGVLATEGTFRSERYASLMKRFGSNVEVIEDPCYGLVELIEAGKMKHAETKKLLAKIISEMLTSGVDTLVLGCTHYPLVLPLIRQIAGNEINIINPAPAIAKRAGHVLRENNLVNPGTKPGNRIFFTSGDSRVMDRQVEELIGLKINSIKISLSGKRFHTS